MRTDGEYKRRLAGPVQHNSILSIKKMNFSSFFALLVCLLSVHLAVGLPFTDLPLAPGMQLKANRLHGRQRSKCQDVDNNCAKWNRNHFCDSPFVPENHKTALCGETCGLC
ncbi:hypothetical protein M3Y99_01129500 [Aphelenchoides fujianensis]|nr:hypothetical protein M3Y99_01129500 [Aphelenchoides fujianensis]